MDVVLLIKAALMGIVEGLTEFLPISSTGHLILAGSLLGFHDERAKVFEIAIQTGAIFAVIIVYWQRLRATLLGLSSQPQAQRFTLNVFIGCLPAVVLGLLLGKAIKAHLFTPTVVATAFILGAFVILWAERRQQASVRVHDLDDLTPLDALKVGLAQCFGLIPGTSRSGSTIIGGMLFGLSRKVATDFSFFLGIPILIGAGAYSLYKARDMLSVADLPLFAVGLLFAFLSAWVCIRWLLRYVASHSFVPFAWYRIAFGALILLTAHFGWVDWKA
ncbi:MAG: undecaprenyl-diphosphatase [Burkholderiales bacterium RIFCSPHIGHO2_02_FULL_66_10]|jgi:undecaprenyl-diphosphatase|uniref:undecaprenyl-diphosphate phosphatase n=1 Tax=Hydrogenophaga sp. TaxID=1904254 RepID=UPI0008B49F09|nr:undecaprenyl-diphosphate phosphatase [Hydrogenophaga sp.]MBU4182142.1 undecaprenyl-diphosphate phosphatase [Gammaproteobacteria bacterium]OGB23855.1 MAG: undecaprenyl-diphosphatase [Burkholderiales bacterium RIFCSPHIGHO2_02_FULL_66_10]OGB31544.1 MAG: undecaprenyl-diphosphatase [Burkholderiales bacterium RIFCSPLOWO2_02_FULL_66_35]PKO77614.1 MAG: undecaprenyl-diphosphatase [Betaproteobacteria bacterium HGW-Betaproteobacteria-15]MBU4280486.1 undecaprenyl-diphosphate phosphatase [Gammaproteobac